MLASLHAFARGRKHYWKKRMCVYTDTHTHKRYQTTCGGLAGNISASSSLGYIHWCEKKRSCVKPPSFDTSETLNT